VGDGERPTVLLLVAAALFIALISIAALAMKARIYGAFCPAFQQSLALVFVFHEETHEDDAEDQDGENCAENYNHLPRVAR